MWLVAQRWPFSKQVRNPTRHIRQGTLVNGMRKTCLCRFGYGPQLAATTAGARRDPSSRLRLFRGRTGATVCMSGSSRDASMNWDAQSKPGGVARAFELAKSGACASVKDIRKRLQVEGYSPRQIEGASLIKQLRSLLRGTKT